MADHEIRQDKATGEWVIFAPERSQRPRQVEEEAPERPDQAQAETCPFCPGHEDQLPGILQETGRPAPPGWQTRVVPNKYAALSPGEHTGRRRSGLYITMPASGRHEVIIESPDHAQDLATMPAPAIKTVIETYHRRYREALSADNVLLAILFRNHGPRAGTSLRHPHAQLVATTLVPRYIRWREAQAQSYFDEWGRCVFCDIQMFEQEERQRIVLENDSFLAFVPFAARVPSEVWIMPRQHQANFGALSPAGQADLAAILRGVLRKLRQGLDDPDYNFVIRSAGRDQSDAPSLHWYLQVRPRLQTQAGFEIGSGMAINPSLPEEDAALLREVPVDG